MTQCRSGTLNNTTEMTQCRSGTYSFENIMHKQMSPNATSDQVYVSDSDTEVQVTCQLALFRSRRIEEQVEHIFRECRAESVAHSTSSDNGPAPTLTTTKTEVTEESIQPQMSLSLASINGGGAPCTRKR